MTKPAIYIDDTGTPQKSKSKYDCGNWESYVAVLLKPNERKEIYEEPSQVDKKGKKNQTGRFVVSALSNIP